MVCLKNRCFGVFCWFVRSAWYVPTLVETNGKFLFSAGLGRWSGGAPPLQRDGAPAGGARGSGRGGLECALGDGRAGELDGREVQGAGHRGHAGRGGSGAPLAIPFHLVGTPDPRLVGCHHLGSWSTPNPHPNPTLVVGKPGRGGSGSTDSGFVVQRIRRGYRDLLSPPGCGR